jgi:DNA-binding transcriptional ArsR family regulator
MVQTTDTHEITDPETWKLLSDPLRRSILNAFAREPRTTKQVSKDLGIQSNKLYHHVELLAKHGLLRLVETRPKRGTTEKYLQAVARRFIVRPLPIGQDNSEEGLVYEIVSDLSQELSNGRFEVDGPITFCIKAELWFDEATRHQFQTRVEELIEELGKDKTKTPYAMTMLAFPLKESAPTA